MNISPSFAKRVEKLTNGQGAIIEQAGFGSLLLIPSSDISKILIAKLIGKWSCEKHCLYLIDDEIYMTSLDVSLIMGLCVTESR